MSDTSSDTSSEYGNLIPYPPSEWTIRPNEEMATYTVTDVEEPLQGGYLLGITRQAGVSGQYRFVLGGTKKLDIKIPAAAALQCGSASKFRLHWQQWPKTIALRPNSMVSNWSDFLER
jgi:hypothetical protein